MYIFDFKLHKYRLTKQLLLSFLVLFFITNSVIAAQIYSLEDLKILYQAKDDSEFLIHAKDVLPSKRDDGWLKMVTATGIRFVASQIKQKRFSTNEFNTIENLTLWPSLRNHEFFIIKRNTFGLNVITKCLKGSDASTVKLTACNNLIARFWTNSPENNLTPEVGYKLSLIVSTYFPNKDLTIYLEKALQKDLSEFFCKKEPVKKFVLMKLQNLSQRDISREKFLTEMQKIAHEECYQSMEKDLRALLFAKKHSISHLAYKVLSARQKLTANEQDTYMALYILHGPMIGSTFNKAWNRITILGREYGRRMLTFNHLKNIDPLPGQLFSISNTKNREILMDHIFTNFPEYFDHYAKTCISFYKGTKTFPNGNPTIECRELFKISKGKNWISKTLHTQYRQLPKL